MKAVHFGAGNIGRGFVGLLLHEGGYELVFSDVAAELVDAINAVDSYTVHEVGEGGTDTVVTGFRAINSAENGAELIEEIAGANVVTTAVGPTILPFVAAPIVAALALRDPSSPPLQIMACENAINATHILRDEIVEQAGEAWDALASRAVFANTAVDRIVPAQPPGGGVDVTVEPFYEWAIERPPFGDDPPHIPGAHFVDDLAPYIERKLFTVNTGHAATAYFGAAAGDETIVDALEDAATQDAYRETALRRFANDALADPVERVGRQPLRKLSRHERLIEPAAALAEQGVHPVALLEVVSAALQFVGVAGDPQSEELAQLLARQSAKEIVDRVTGLEAGHPLRPALVDRVAVVQRAR